MKTDIPWSELRVQYVTGRWLTLRGLAEANDVSYSAVRRRAKAEGWQRLRRGRALRSQLSGDEAELEASLKAAKLAARDLLACIHSRRKLSIDLLARLGFEARFPVSNIWTSAVHVIQDRAALADLEKGGSGEIEPFPFPYPGAPESRVFGSTYEPVLARVE